MINKYRWYEIVGIYLGIAAFLSFILAPFLEAFLVSLRPLTSRERETIVRLLRKLG